MAETAYELGPAYRVYYSYNVDHKTGYYVQPTLTVEGGDDTYKRVPVRSVWYGDSNHTAKIAYETQIIIKKLVL